MAARRKTHKLDAQSIVVITEPQARDAVRSPQHWCERVLPGDILLVTQRSPQGVTYRLLEIADGGLRAVSNHSDARKPPQPVRFIGKPMGTPTQTPLDEEMIFRLLAGDTLKGASIEALLKEIDGLLMQVHGVARVEMLLKEIDSLGADGT